MLSSNQLAAPQGSLWESGPRIKRQMHLKLVPRRTSFFVYDEGGAAHLPALAVQGARGPLA